MQIVDRAKNIILSPKSEWNIIQFEAKPPKLLLTQYVIPLAALAGIAAFLGLWLFGVKTGFSKVGGFNWGLSTGIGVFVQDVASVILSAYVIDALAPYFNSEKNLEKSMQLVGYSYTPALVGGLLYIIPPLSFIGSLFGLYGIYLWYVGLSPMKGTPEDKKVVYLIISIVVLIIISAIVGYILNAILGNFFSTNLPRF